MRAVVGGLSILLFCQQFLSLKKIPFDYHYHSNEDKVQDFRSGNYVLSVKYFQHVLNKYDNPKIDDLIICELPDRSLQFRVVKAVPKSYFYDIQSEMEYYVPLGFVVLYDPLSKQSKMECIGNVRGNQHYILY